MQNIVLHTTNCPRCIVLKEKLNACKLSYSINEDIDIMFQKGIKHVPILEVDGELLDFAAAVRLLKVVSSSL